MSSERILVVDENPASPKLVSGLPDQYPNGIAVRRCVLFARASSVAVTVIGCLVLAGWLLGVGRLKSVFPGYDTMKANTAMGFLLTGAAFTLFSLEKRTKSTRLLTMLAGALVVTLGVLTLSEYLGGWNLGIDEWLSRDDPNAVGTSEPGRMAPGTAFCFVMIGIAWLVSACAIPARWRHPLLAGLGAAVIVAGVLAFACYLSDASLHSHWWHYSGMAFDTATAFILLGCALLALVKSEGGMTWALNRTITTGFIVGVAIMVITSGFSYGLTNRLLETASWVSHTREVLEKIQEVASGMADMESGQRGYMIMGDERLLEERKRAETAVHESLAELRRLTADNGSQQRRLDPLKTLVRRRIEFGDQTIAARQDKSLPTAEAVIATGTEIKLSDDIRQRLNEMRNEEYALLKKRQDESNAASTSAFLLLPLGALFGLTVLSLGLFFLNAGVGERALAESALQQSEARMAGIVTSAMDAIISIDKAQRIVLFNSAAEKMFRLPAAEIMGQSLDRLIPQRFRGQHGQHVEGFGKTGVTSRSMRSLGVLSGLRADGEEFPIEASISHATVSGQKIYTVILRDITERKRADEAAALLAAIVESSSDAIVGKNLESKVTSWNAGAARMFGYEARQIIGHSITLLIPPNRQDDEGRILARIKRGESVEHFETVRVKKDGGLIDVSVTVSPIRNSSGEIIGASNVARDITERKRADAALREMEKEKQLAFEASRLKSEFLANMSHELRTPLNCIIGFTEFLADEKPGPLNPKQKEYLTDVYNSSKHLLQLINDVLDLAKVEAGKIELHLESFPLAKAIEEVCAVVKGIAQKKGVSVTSRVAPDANVTLDQQKFKQVCYNLMSNAVKFTAPGGGVEITALAGEGEHFEVRVKDTGIGIKQEDLHRLFREFEQLDSGSDRRFEGTGLGLALTKKLVESHGGSIGVESEYGKGSTFFAVLPKAIAEVKNHE